MRREWFRTTAVEVDTRDILHYDLCCLDRKFGIGGTDLEDEVRFLDGMGCEDGPGDAIEGYNAGYSCLD